MSAAAVVSRADARMWCRHFYQAIVQGVAEGIDNALMTSGAGIVATGLDSAVSAAAEVAPHLPADQLWKLVVSVAVLKAVHAAAQFLRKNPGPTGDEVIEPGDKPA